ncbi:MAG: lysophospholipid acyltransferase family protein [Gammaproteobacteria bacterium]
MPNHDTNKLFIAINYVWRVLATGFSFLLFGIGGVILSIFLYSISYLIPMSHNRKLAFIRGAISRTFGFYLLFLRLCGLLSVEFHGRELIKPGGQLIIANHPSLLDVTFLISLVKQADCVVKASLFRTPLTRGPVSAAKYIRNDSTRLIQDCVQSLDQGNSLIIFPEGTRTQPGKPLSFHRGVANVALMAKKDITPITISCEPATLLKNQKWYQIPDRTPHFTISILPDISIKPYLDMDLMQSQKARRLNRSLMEFFTARQPG